MYVYRLTVACIYINVSYKAAILKVMHVAIP